MQVLKQVQGRQANEYDTRRLDHRSVISVRNKGS